MHMSKVAFDALDKSTLEVFVERGIEEGSYLDYKSAIVKPLTNDSKKELLKDVSGFANAGGGVIIYGCHEPAQDLQISQQLVGIENGPELAADMERVLSDCLDPRVSGLGIRSITLDHQKSAIVVYIPASGVRPHMVTFRRANQFYKRHSESTQIMNAQEVKSVVLNTYNRDDVIERMDTEVMSEFRESSFNEFGSCIVMQAIPLVEPAEKWDVFSRNFSDALMGLNSRNNFEKSLSLKTDYNPMIDVERRIAIKSSVAGSCSWALCAKTNGHVYLFCDITGKLENITFNGVSNRYKVFNSWINQIFCAFGAVIDEIQKVEDSAQGYKVVSRIMNCGDLALYRDTRSFDGGYLQLIGKNQINMPTKLAMPGESVKKVCETVGESVYQAFGVLPAKGELKTGD